MCVLPARDSASSECELPGQMETNKEDRLVSEGLGRESNGAQCLSAQAHLGCQFCWWSCGQQSRTSHSQSCAGEGRKGNRGAKSHLVIVASLSSEAMAGKVPELDLCPCRPLSPSQVTMHVTENIFSSLTSSKPEPVSSTSATSLQWAHTHVRHTKHERHTGSLSQGSQCLSQRTAEITVEHQVSKPGLFCTLPVFPGCIHRRPASGQSLHVLHLPTDTKPRSSRKCAFKVPYPYVPGSQVLPT